MLQTSSVIAFGSHRQAVLPLGRVPESDEGFWEYVCPLDEVFLPIYRPFHSAHDAVFTEFRENEIHALTNGSSRGKQLYAKWDLVFHTISLSIVDLDFAKEQLYLMLRDMYIHPSGEIPACDLAISHNVIRRMRPTLRHKVQI